MNGNSIWVIIVLIIVIAGGWFLLSPTPADIPSAVTTEQTPVTTSATVDVPPTPSTATVTSVTVLYNDQGFSPSNITVAPGTTVTFVNQSSEGMWVASAMHPTHTAYSGTSLSQHCPDTDNSTFDGCKAEAPGSSFSFTFNKEGVWKYHDHMNASRFGSVMVTAAASAGAPI